MDSVRQTKINFNKFVLDTVNENKMFYLSTILVITSIILMQVVFPKLYGDLVANFSDGIETMDYSKMIIVLMPYITSELLYYISDTIQSTTIPEIELSIVKKVSNSVIESIKTSKNEFNHNQFILNLKKIFDFGASYNSIIAYVVPAIIVSIGISWHITSANVSAGIVTIIILVVTFFSLIYMSGECSNQTNITEEKINEFCDEVDDVFGNIENVMASGTDKTEINRIDEEKKIVHNNCVNKELCSTKLKFTFSIAYFIIMIVLNGISLRLYYGGNLTKSTLIAIFFMILSLVMLYDSLIHELQNITSNIGIYQEVRSYFDNFEINNENELSDDMVITNGDIKFENISVKFNENVIFDNFNLDLEGGTKIGILGEIGSGKSTLLKILVDVIQYQGNVYIDNQNTKKFKHNTVAKHIAYIPQNPKLFNRSILENLNYGSDPKIYNEEKVIDLLKYYDLYQLFLSFEEVLRTNVGKDGKKVSGGQRQIIYILRSLIQNKSILILDEPTSSLDAEYKTILFNLLNRINDKTIIVVTHDKEILNLFDRVIIMGKGKIIDDTARY